MSVKTKGVRKILEPIEAQINKLRELLGSRSDSLENAGEKSLLVEQLHALAGKFEALARDGDCDYEDVKTRISDTVKEFCNIKDINQLTESVNSQTAEKALGILLDKFTLALRTLEDLECLPLKQSLQDCWDYVRDMGIANEIEDFQNVKELGASILDIYVPLQRYRRSLVSKLLSEKLALYSRQLSIVFCMLVELVKEQHQLNAPVYDCKKYLCERMCLCFKLILEIMDGSNPSLEDEAFDQENHFVYRMDLVLDIISEMSTKTHEEQISECKELWLGIEDVFSHAMAIAQICQPYNFKAITGACQSIVSEYENLKIQLLSEKPDPALNNLFMNTLTDALYRLERKVNISVLTLVMEVFSDPFHALKKLVMSCGNSLSAKQRSKHDLSSSIEEFDQVTDKAMQIGMFAIACCKDVNRVNTVRNCLAGLESLETELVSAITAFYLHPDNKEMRAGVKLLTAQWQLEMNTLHQAVDLITDSAAYCQVVLDDLQERITVMSDCLDNREPVTQSQVQGVVQRALSLSSQITRTVDDIGSENIERQTIMMIRELKAAIFEADAAAKNLLVDNATEPQQLRVIKRCELILNVVKRLQPALVTVMNSSMLKSTNCGKSSKGQGDTLHGIDLNFPSTVYGLPRDEKTPTYIRTPYTVKTHKPQLSIQLANSTPRKQADLSCLMPYIQKGREMRLEKSIMYKTPRKLENSDTSLTKNKLNMRNLSNVRQHLFSRDSFVSCSYIDESIDLTAILEKVNSLSGTLVSNTSKSLADRKESPSSKDPSKATNSSTIECSTIGGGDAPSKIETLERIDDIQRLDRKIETLQKCCKEKDAE